MAHKHTEGSFEEDQNLPPTPSSRKRQLAQWQAQKHTRATPGKDSAQAETRESPQLSKPLNANPLLVNSESAPQTAKYLKNASARPSSILSPGRLQRTPSKVFTPKAIRVPLPPQNETPKPARVPLPKTPKPFKPTFRKEAVKTPGPLDAIASRVAVLKSSLTPQRSKERETPKKEELQASYWLRRIREAETHGNHGMVISLFEQAVEVGAQPGVDLVKALQRYRAKHVSSKSIKAKQPKATRLQSQAPKRRPAVGPPAQTVLEAPQVESSTQHVVKGETAKAAEEIETAVEGVEELQQIPEDPTEVKEVAASEKKEGVPLTSPVNTVAVTPLSARGSESPTPKSPEASGKEEGLQDFEVYLTPLRRNGPKQAPQQEYQRVTALDDSAKCRLENKVAAKSTPPMQNMSPTSTPGTDKTEELLPRYSSPVSAPSSPTILLSQTWANASPPKTPKLRNPKSPQGGSPTSFLRLPQTPRAKTPPADVMLTPPTADLILTTPLLAPADVMRTPAVTPTSWQPSEEAQPQPGSGPGQSTPSIIQMPSVQRSASRVTPDVIRTPGLSRRLNLDAEESKVRTPLSRFALRSPLGSARRVALTPEAAPPAREDSGVKGSPTSVANFPVVLNGRKSLKPSPLNFQTASKHVPLEKSTPVRKKQSPIGNASSEAQAGIDKPVEANNIDTNPALATDNNPQAGESGAVDGFVRIFAHVATETVLQQKLEQPKSDGLIPEGKKDAPSNLGTPGAGKSVVANGQKGGGSSMRKGQSPKVGASKEIEGWLKRAHGREGSEPKAPSPARVNLEQHGEVDFPAVEDGLTNVEDKEGGIEGKRATPSSSEATFQGDSSAKNTPLTRASRTAGVNTLKSAGVESARRAERTPVSGAKVVNRFSSSVGAARVNTPPKTALESASKGTPLLRQERGKLRQLVIDNSARTPASARKQGGQLLDDLLPTPKDRRRSSFAPENMTPGAASAGEWAAAAEVIHQKHASIAEETAAFGSPLSAPSDTPAKEPTSSYLTPANEPTSSCKTPAKAPTPSCDSPAKEPTFICRTPGNALTSSCESPGNELTSSCTKLPTSSPDTPPPLPELTPRDVDIPALRANQISPRVVTPARQLSARFTPSRLSRPSPLNQQESASLLANLEVPQKSGLTTNRGVKLQNSMLSSPAQRTPGKSVPKTGTRELRQLGGTSTLLDQGAPGPVTTILTPVRASKQAREALGAEKFVLSPVRRSSRKPSELKQSTTQVLEMLETTGFVYTPNKALAPAHSANKTPAARRMAQLTRGDSPPELADVDLEEAATCPEPENGASQDVGAENEAEKDDTEIAEECETERNGESVQVESPDQEESLTSEPAETVALHTHASEPENGEGVNGSRSQEAAAIHTLTATRGPSAGAAEVAPSVTNSENEAEELVQTTKAVPVTESVNELTRKAEELVHTAKAAPVTKSGNGPSGEAEGPVHPERAARKLPAIKESLGEGLQMKRRRAVRKSAAVSDNACNEIEQPEAKEGLSVRGPEEKQTATGEKKLVSIAPEIEVEEKTYRTRRHKNTSQKADAQEDRRRPQSIEVKDQTEKGRANAPLKNVSFDPALGLAEGKEVAPESKTRRRGVRKTAGKASDVRKDGLSEGLSDGLSEQSADERKERKGRTTRRFVKQEAGESVNGIRGAEQKKVVWRVKKQKSEAVKQAHVAPESTAVEKVSEAQAVTSARRTRGRQAEVEVGSVVVKKTSHPKSAINKESGVESKIKESKVAEDQKESTKKQGEAEAGVGERGTGQRAEAKNSEGVVGKTRRAVLKDTTNAPATARGKKGAKQSEKLTSEDQGVEQKGESVAAGTRIQIWWADDKRYYSGVVTAFKARSGKHKVQYDDGESEELVLSEETWRLEKARRAGRA